MEDLVTDVYVIVLSAGAIGLSIIATSIVTGVILMIIHELVKGKDKEKDVLNGDGGGKATYKTGP